MNHRPVLAAIACAVGPALLPAQPSYLDLTVNDVGIAIGDAPRVTGVRINFRDRYLERVNGVNITVWTPYVATGDVRGIAIGVPATGARNIDGLALGLGGVGAEERCAASPSLQLGLARGRRSLASSSRGSAVEAAGGSLESRSRALGLDPAEAFAV